MGKTRARQDEKVKKKLLFRISVLNFEKQKSFYFQRLTGEKGTRRRGASLCVLMHGDSAAAGQGVVAEVNKCFWKRKREKKIRFF